ncbi:MAG: hypothetical protein K2J65_05680 [Duncaniella sp.]|nr:hypothetical protein [Duncaniella sp.]
MKKVLAIAILAIAGATAANAEVKGTVKLNTSCGVSQDVGYDDSVTVLDLVELLLTMEEAFC